MAFQAGGWVKVLGPPQCLTHPRVLPKVLEFKTTKM